VRSAAEIEQAYIGRVGLPARYAAHTFAGYDSNVSRSAAAALAAAQELADGRIGSLVLIGKPGVGKTHLAASAVKAWIVRRVADEVAEGEEHQRAVDAWKAENPDPFRAKVLGIPAPRRPESMRAPAWLNVPTMLIGLRSEMGDEERPWRGTVASARSNPELVVLDDIGREKASDWTSEVLYELVNARYEAMLPTMATSNLTGEELVAAGYWPIVSRLAEGGRLVTVEAADHRLRRVS
jgi:DNA replication protein DnaC